MADCRLPCLARARSQTIHAATDLIVRYFPWLTGGALIGAAFFSYPGRDHVLVGMLLFLPLLDRGWRPPTPPWRRRYLPISASLLLAGVALLLWQPAHLYFAVSTLLLAAVPEEWFFRAYFMTRLGGHFQANLLTTVVFSLLHGLTRDWATALLVLAPSLIYGWLYQRTRDLPLLVLVHALSNLVYVLFLAGFVATWAPDLR